MYLILRKIVTVFRAVTFLFALPIILYRMAKNSINRLKVKVKVTLVQALRFCTGRTAYRGGRGIALPFLDHGTRRG